MSKDKKVDSEEMSSENRVRLTILVCKRDALFARLQSIYDLSKSAAANDSQREVFLSNVSNIDTLRSDFEQALDNYNTFKLQMNPEEKINFQAWLSFDEMYCYVKRVISQIDINYSTSKCSTQDTPSISKSKPKLPPIELMSFNGDIRNWSLFYQQFKSVVHDNTDLTDSERVYYLVGKLTDNAKTVCAGLPPTAENYNIIWSALIDKYDDPRVLAASYLNQLLEFKPLNNNSASDFERFINNFNFSVEALKQLQITDLSDFIFMHIALQKLDLDTVKLFETMYRKQKIPSYASLIEFVREQSKVMSRSNVQRFTDSVSNKLRNKIPVPKRTKSFVNTDVDLTNRVNKGHSCSLCKNDAHEHLYQCRVFMSKTPYDRFVFVKIMHSVTTV